jgi:hypothetical protein
LLAAVDNMLYNAKQLFNIGYAYSAAPQSLKDLSRLTCGRFHKLFRHLVKLLGRVTSLSQVIYLHVTAQHRKTRTNTHALSGIRTHDPSFRVVNAYAPDCVATVTDQHRLYFVKDYKVAQKMLIKTTLIIITSDGT